jgi:hypothetical protein
MNHARRHGIVIRAGSSIANETRERTVRFRTKNNRVHTAKIPAMRARAREIAQKTYTDELRYTTAAELVAADLFEQPSDIHGCIRDGACEHNLL